MPYEDMIGMQHRLELDGRERLVVSGVEEVERFDEEEIVMNTTALRRAGRPAAAAVRLRLWGTICRSSC